MQQEIVERQFVVTRKKKKQSSMGTKKIQSTEKRRKKRNLSHTALPRTWRGGRERDTETHHSQSRA
jgi:hypothetical protein